MMSRYNMYKYYINIVQYEDRFSLLLPNGHLSHAPPQTSARQTMLSFLLCTSEQL